MNRWDALFVNEMSHNYQRYLKRKDREHFEKVLREGLTSANDFQRAFTAGLVMWLADKEFDISNEIKIDSCTLKEPSFPTMYEHPSANARVLEKCLPEFKQFGVLITNFG